MKKLLALLTITVAFVACNNASENNASSADTTTTVTVDTTTTITVDTTTGTVVDSTKISTDTTTVVK